MYAAVLVIAVVTTSYTRTGYCQISEEAFEQLQIVEYKWTTQWLSRAYVKTWYVFALDVLLLV